MRRKRRMIIVLLVLALFAPVYAGVIGSSASAHAVAPVLPASSVSWSPADPGRGATGMVARAARQSIPQNSNPEFQPIDPSSSVTPLANINCGVQPGMLVSQRGDFQAHRSVGLSDQYNPPLPLDGYLNGQTSLRPSRSKKAYFVLVAPRYIKARDLIQAPPQELFGAMMRVDSGLNQLAREEDQLLC